MALNMERAGAGVLFLLGLDTSYNVASAGLSAPQTTELRTMGAEGGGANEATLMKWVWIANVKTLIYTGFSSILARSWWPLLGGVVVTVDIHGSYRYALACGRRSPTPGGRVMESLSMGGGMTSRRGGVLPVQQQEHGTERTPGSSLGDPQEQTRTSAANGDVIMSGRPR